MVVHVVNYALGYPKYDVELSRNEGQSMMAAHWPSLSETFKIALIFSSTLGGLAVVLGLATRIKYGYHSLLGYGVSLGLTSIFYGTYVIYNLPLS